jgi:hypothetical protein
MTTHFDNPTTPHANASSEVLALLALNTELLSNNSATLTLERWCDRHGLASPARVIAKRIHGAEKPSTVEQRQLLSAQITDHICYRRVRLCCGGLVLSEADNWYLPGRLTPEMNWELEDTDTAFGRVVQTLDFRRRTLSAKYLWSPPSAVIRMRDLGTDRLQVPFRLLEHRAVLTLPDGTPFCLLTEIYTSALLAFLKPSRRAA